MRRNEKQQKDNKVPRLSSLVLLFTLVSTCLLSGTLAKYTSTVYGADTARVAKFDFGAKVNNVTLSDDVTAPATITLFSETYANNNSTLTVASDGTIAPTELVAPGTSGDFVYEFSGKNEVAVRLGLTIKETNDKKVPLFYEYNGKYYANDAVYAKYPTYFDSSTGQIDSSNEIRINVSNTDASNPTYVVLDNATNFGGNFAAMVTATQNNLADLAGGSISTGIIPPNTNLAGIATADPTNVGRTVTWHWPFTVEASSDSGTTYTNVSDAIDTALGKEATTASGTGLQVTLDMNATLTQVD